MLVYQRVVFVSQDLWGVYSKNCLEIFLKNHLISPCRAWTTSTSSAWFEDGSADRCSSLVKKSPMEKVLWMLWIRKIKGKSINGPVKSNEIPWNPNVHWIHWISPLLKYRLFKKSTLCIPASTPEVNELAGEMSTTSSAFETCFFASPKNCRKAGNLEWRHHRTTIMEILLGIFLGLLRCISCKSGAAPKYKLHYNKPNTKHHLFRWR